MVAFDFFVGVWDFAEVWGGWIDKGLVFFLKICLKALFGLRFVLLSFLSSQRLGRTGLLVLKLNLFQLLDRFLI